MTASDRPTIRDVAKHAQVSPMTVSRTLRDDPRVADNTRARVREAVAALGYQRNHAARNLRLGRSDGVIGLVVTNLVNPFYAQLALGVEAVAEERGARVIVGNSSEDRAREEQLLRDFAARGLAGVIVVPSSNDQAHLDPQSHGGMPVVLATSPPVRIDTDAVLLDDFSGAWEATRHLVGKGHERIAFLGLAASSWTGSERFRGYCAALEEAGLPLVDALVSREQRDTATAKESTLAWLDAPHPPTAVFCANNRNTIGAYRAIRARGATTTLAGFDDFELADLLAPLTVVAYDPRELGREAVRLLFDRIEAPRDEPPLPPRRMVVPTEIVEYGARYQQ